MVFFLVFLWSFVPYIILHYFLLVILVILFAVDVYRFGQYLREIEDRLFYLEEAESRRQRREDQRDIDEPKKTTPLKNICGNCHLFLTAECERKERDSNGQICEHYLGPL